MSDQEEPVYPPADILTLFTDGASNMAWGEGVAKVLCARQDASIQGPPGIRTAAVVQIVMPIGGFVATTLFFNRMLDRLKSEGVVTDEMLDRLASQETARS